MIAPSLDLSAKGVAWNEFEASRKQSEARLFAWDEMRGRYHGPYWDRTAKHGAGEPENPAYEIIATMKAQFIAGDPMCTAKAMRVDKPETRGKAIALRHTINRLSRDADHKTFFGMQFVDWSMAFDIVGVQRTPAPWSDRGPVDGPLMRPRLFRISPTRYRADPRATELNEERWRGYVFLASKAAVLARASKNDPNDRGWRKPEIEKIQADSGIDKMLPSGGKDVKRDDFKMYIAWVPEEEQGGKFTGENGFWGTMHFFAETSRGGEPLVEIRDPQPYYGARRGPFYKSGQEHVPDSTHPLAIMQAIESIAKSLRLQSVVIDNAMRIYKRIMVTGGAGKGIAGKIKTTVHNGVVHIDGFDARSMAKEFSIGGVDADTLTAYQFLIERLNTRAGLSSTARGQAQSDTTATAEAIAQGGSAARMEGLRDTWYAHVRECQRALGEILCMDEQFYMPLAPEAVQEMVQAGVPQNMIPQYVQGGHEEGESFEDYEINIEPLSMRYQTQEEREMAAEREMGMWGNFVAMISNPVAASIDMKGILGDLGDKWNQPELPERFNAPLAEQIAGVMLMGAIQSGQGAFETGSAPQGQPGTSPKPRTMDVTAISAQPAKPQQAGLSAGTPKPQGKPGASSGAKAGGMAKRKAKVGARG